MSAITITIPDTLYVKIQELAQRDASTIEQFALLALAEKTSSLLTTAYLEERAARVTPGRLRELLAQAPDVPPSADDVIDS
jgi:hypothetical protein